MSMDVTTKRSFSEMQGGSPDGSNAQASGPAGSGGPLAPLDPNSAAFGERLTMRAKFKAAVDALLGQDGVDTKASPKTSPKSKLDTNPYAPSNETMRRVATRADAGPVIPPPSAHVRPITPQASRIFADRFAMRTAQAATVAAGAAAAGAGAAAAAGLTSPEAVRAAIIEGIKNPETLTPAEAAHVKQLVGRAPPASTFATLTDAELKAAASPPTFGAASSHDSYASLRIAATTYVPWQQFFVTLTKKQQADLATWLMQRQKLQLLTSSITITMLEADKQLTKQQSALDQAETLIKLVVAVEQVKNSLSAGAMGPLTNSGFNVMRSAADLSKGQNQNEDRAPTHDLHRMAFLRRVFEGQAAANVEHAHYIKNAEALGLAPQPHNTTRTDSLSVPADPRSGATGAIALKRSVLSEDEMRELNPAARAQYDAAIKDMYEARKGDWPGYAALYAHEENICRSATARYEAIAEAPHTSPADAATASTHAATWKRRGDQIAALAKPWQDALQARSAALMVDENRYGDLLRERGHLANKRKEVNRQLTDTQKPVTALEREHLERMGLNIDWRAIALDRELSRFSNPHADNRLRRWHTGAKNIADGFYLAFVEKNDTGRAPAGTHPERQMPALRWNTMVARAPVGAVDTNGAYIQIIQKLRTQTDLSTLGPNSFTDVNLNNINRTQLLRHINDRKDALKRFGGQGPNGAFTSLHEDARVRDFHAAEVTHLAAAEQFIRSSPLFQGGTRPKGVMGALSFNAIAPKLAIRALARAPVTYKDDTAALHRASVNDVPPPEFALDPAKATKFYAERAEAGAAITGADSDSRAAGYQNKLFERLNVVANAQQYVNFDPMDQAATQSAMGNTQDIIGEAAANFSEVFSQMAQERQQVQSAIEQIISEVFHVPT